MADVNDLMMHAGLLVVLVWYTAISLVGTGGLEDWQFFLPVLAFVVLTIGAKGKLDAWDRGFAEWNDIFKEMDKAAFLVKVNCTLQKEDVQGDASGTREVKKT